MSNNIKLTVTLFTATLITLCGCSSQYDPKKKTVQSLTPRPVDFSKPIACHIKYLQEGFYDLKHNKLELTGPEAQTFGEMLTSFDFTKTPYVTVHSVGLNDVAVYIGVVIQDDKTKIVVVENRSDLDNHFAYQPVFIHTIFKDTGIYTYHKINTLISLAPRSTTSMGYCN